MQDVQKITEIQSMKIYLDNCCFARPYNDQTSLPIRLESEATLDIQTNPYTLAGTTNHERIQRNIWFFHITHMAEKAATTKNESLLISSRWRDFYIKDKIQ